MTAPATADGEASAAGTWLMLAGRRIEVDARGYLADPEDWDEALAEAMAASDGIALDAQRWQVLRLLRAYHAEHGHSPAMRVLVRLVAAELGAAADSRLLYRLFPQGPAKQAARWAGLPRPTSCI